MLLRKKHEPQPAIEAAAPPKNEEKSAQSEASQTGERTVASEIFAEDKTALSEAVAAADASIVGNAAKAEVADKQVRQLLIAAGISFRGEIAGCDHLVIDGVVEGEIKACRRIAVSDGGSFNGVATTIEAEIAGSCGGSLTVNERLFVARTARVLGSVRYARLVVEDGGVLDGDIRQVKAEVGSEAGADLKTPALRRVDVTKAGIIDSVGKSEATDAGDRVAPNVGEAQEVERMFASAAAARDLSRFGEAEALFKAVIARRPEHAAALANLGKLARQRGDRAAALGYFEAAAKADPQNVWARCDAAAMLHELARKGEAEAIYKSILEVDAKHVGALNGLGQLAKERGDRAAALGYFEATVAADPANPWARCDVAAILRDLARHDDAEAMFKSVLETHPEHVGALTGLGHLARQRRNRIGALGYFEAAAKADPRNPWVSCDLANILRELSRFGEAEAMLKGVLESHKDQIGALTGLGHIARQRGDFVAALAHFEAALKANPQNPDLRCELATVLRELARLDEAESMLKAVLETHPRHVAALTGLGHLARQREDRAGTLRWFEAAMAAEPEDLSIRVEFARALRQQGEFARARQIIDKALDDESAAANG